MFISFQRTCTRTGVKRVVVLIVALWSLVVGREAVEALPLNKYYKPLNDLPPMFELSLLCNPPENKPGHVPRALDHYDAQARYDAVPDFNGTSTVKVRFVATHTKKNKQLFDFVTTARLAGVPVEILGLGWKGFSLINRQKLIVDYAIAANLSDEDVVVMLDSDMLFTGRDLYPLVQEYVSSSPATPGSCDAKLVRLNKQTAPVLFSAENNCMRLGGVPGNMCGDQYHSLEKMMTAWAQKHGLIYMENIHAERNENRYLNNGLVIGRVWALKRLRTAYFDYVSSSIPAEGSEWTMDQAVYADLYVNLRFWELQSGLLSDTNRAGRVGPYGLVGGMIGLDYLHHFVAPIHIVNAFSLIRYGSVRLSRSKPVQSFHSETVKNLRIGGVNVSFSAAGALMANKAVSFVPKVAPATCDKCFGVPHTNGFESPIWHFCGGEKSTFIPEFLSVLPTRVVLDAFPEERDVAREVFRAAPPTRVWLVSEHTPEEGGFYTLIGDSDFNITTQSLCAMF